MKRVMTYFSLVLLIGVGAFLFLWSSQQCDAWNCEQTTNFDKKGVVENYSLEWVKKAQERGDAIAYFFEASWCANCQISKEDFIKKWVPSWYTLFFVDFDKHQELKTQYAIKNQHTFILTNENWNKTFEDISGNYDTIVKTLH